MVRFDFTKFEFKKFKEHFLFADEPNQNNFTEADLARSLLFTISNDVGQIACLYAMMHNLKKVIL